MIFESQLARCSAVQSQFQPQTRPQLQRKCVCGGTPGSTGECEECNAKKKRLQRRPLTEHDSRNFAPGARALVNRTLRGPAHPLDSATRTFFEPRFGHDFGAVRIHRGADADVAAQSVNAAAFTVGRDIVFASPFYEPETITGRQLLAHELAHTIQQGGDKVQAAGDFQIGNTHDPAEAEADQAATSVTTNELLKSSALSPVAPTLARIDCSTLTYKTCKGQSCGYGGSGVCGWGGISLGCRCMGATKPTPEKVLEVLLIIGISITLLITIIAALADPEPATKLGLAGLSAAQIALLLEMLGYEKRTASTSEGTATLGGDATAVRPENVA